MTWCIAGHGKVASALAKRLTERGVAFEQVSARGWANGNGLPSNDCRALFLALPDDVISEAAVCLGAASPSYPVFHCSGATPLLALEALPLSGVWYPMQSFRSSDVPWGRFRIFWENEALENVLNDWHQALGLELPANGPPPSSAEPTIWVPFGPTTSPTTSWPSFKRTKRKPA
jgi:hypothetical protein